MKRKSMLPTPADLTLDEITSRFGTDEKARAYLDTDGERTVSALKCAEGKRMTLKPLKGGLAKRQK